MGFPAPHVWLGGTGSGNPDKPSVNPSRHTQTMQKPPSNLRLLEFPRLKASSKTPALLPDPATHECSILDFSTEEPGFTAHRGFLQPTPTVQRVELRSQGPDRSWIASWICTRFRRDPSPGAPRLTVGQRILSFVTIALLLTLGAVAANRSVSAFQTAWRVTDTTTAAPAMVADTPAPNRYDFQNAEVPGPFEKGSTLWSALRKHLRLTPQDTQPPKAGQ
jgi:hypothetical protein